MKPITKTTWILLFSIAMGFLESAVVVYLRALYYPAGFDFPLKAMDHSIAGTELLREAATLIMILAVSIVAGKTRLQRFAWFLLVFAVWDITYYLFLKTLLGWPDSFLTPDILFLLPSLWTGPVLAPLINSFTMILLASLILYERKGTKPVSRLSAASWALLVTGTLIVLFAYTKDFASFVSKAGNAQAAGNSDWSRFMMEMSLHFIPRPFDWLVFGTGAGMHLAAVCLVFFKKSVRQ